MAKYTQEYCIKHGHGPFVQTYNGLVCASCLLEASKRRRTPKGMGYYVNEVKKDIKSASKR